MGVMCSSPSVSVLTSSGDPGMDDIIVREKYYGSRVHEAPSGNSGQSSQESLGQRKTAESGQCTDVQSGGGYC